MEVVFGKKRGRCALPDPQLIPFKIKLAELLAEIQLFLEIYPEDVFVEKPEEIVIIRNEFKKILARRVL